MAEDIASLAIRVDSLEARNAERDLRNLESQGRRTASSTDAMGAAFRSLGVVLGGLTLTGIAKDILNVNREMETLRMSLVSVTGSAKDAQKSFQMIQDFAKGTPFEIKGLTQNFITLQNMGIKPTQQVMQSLTDQASKLGGSQETLNAIVLQLGQAYSKQKLQMEDMVILMERGVDVLGLLEEATGRSSSELVEMSKKSELTRDVIDKLIVKMGELASGSNARAMDTLNGKISSLADAWHTFEDALLNDTSETLIRRIVKNWTLVIEDFTNKITGGDLMGRIDKQIAETKQNLSNMQSGGVASVVQTVPYKQNAKDLEILLGLKADLAASDAAEMARDQQKLESEKKNLEIARKTADESVKQRQADEKAAEIIGELSRKNFELTHSKIDVIKADLQAQGVTGKALEDALKLASANEKLSATTTKHTAARRSHIAVISEAQKAESELNRAYDQEMKALQDNNARLSQSAREYQQTRLAAKGLTDEMITQAMRIYDANTAWEEKLKLQQSEKDALEQLIDEYNRLTLSARDYYRTQLDLAGIKGKDQEPLLKQFDKNTSAEANQKLIADNSAALQAYADEVDNTNSSMERLSATTNDVFSTSLGGINQLTGAMDAMVDSIKQSSDEFTALTKKLADIEEHKPNISASKTDWDNYNKARTDGEKQLANLQQKTIGNYIDGVSTMAGAVAAMYDENSNEAKAFNIIAIAGLAAKAATAMLTQGQGDPYTAFARIAAMGALVSGIVAAGGGGAFSWGGSGGGAAAPKGTTGTGTVLGDKEATSNSINSTHDLLKSIHAEEYAELRGINSGVSKLADGITNTVTRLFQAGGIKQLVPDTSNKISGLFGSIINGLFGSTTKTTVGSGITFGGNRIGEDAGGYQYSTIETKKKSWFSSKTTYSQAISALDEGTREALTDVFKNMGDVMSDVAASIGSIIGKDVGKRVKEYMIPAMTVELHGLSGEEAAKKLNAAISSTLDTMSEVVFGDIIGQYQKLGEGMLETAIRIVSEVAVVKDALNQSGIKIADNAIALSDSLVQAAGGLEEFQQQFNDFYDKFFSSAEKQSRLQDRLNETFREVYLLLPRTREEYRKVIDSLNVNNALDRERYSLMLQLSSAADQYYTSIETGSSTATQTQQQQYDQQIQWLRITGDEVNAVALERQREYEAMDASLVPMQKIIDSYGDLVNQLNNSYNAAADLLTSTFTKFYQLAKSLNAYSESLKDSALTTESPEQKYLNNKAEFEALKEVIDSGPGKTKEGKEEYRLALEKLQGISQDFIESSRGYNASSEAYAADFNSVIQTLNTGAKKAGNVATNAEEQLNALNKMVTGLDVINLSIINMDGTVSKVNESVGTVKDAVKGMTSATIALNRVEKDRAKAERIAARSENKSEMERAKEERILKREEAAANKAIQEAAILAEKQSAYNKAIAVGDTGAMTKLAASFGVPLAIQSIVGGQWSQQTRNMIGGFDPGKSAGQWRELEGLMYEYKTYLQQVTFGFPLTHNSDYFSNRIAEINSHANGLGFVPYDNYMARLHQGEKVVTAFDARKNETEMKQIYNDILTELKIANRQRAAGNTEMIKKTDKLIDSNEAQTRSIRRIAV